jgi:hypothetical protein
MSTDYTPPKSWAEEFGEDQDIGYTPHPGLGEPGRSAKDMGRAYHRARYERQLADDQELVATAARELDEDDALDDVLRIHRKGGGNVPRGHMAKARAALERRGYHQGSTADRLARMAGQGQGWRAL